MRLAIKFAYDGTKFFGSSRQPRLRTVEGEIIDCLKKYQVIDDLKESRFQVASRTDAKVSAIANVMAFNTVFKEKNVLNILNSKTDDCWFYGITNVKDEFNPRKAKMRWYRYHLPPRGRELVDNAKRSLDINRLKSAFKLFFGTHDFKNFAKPNLENTLRTIDSITASEKNEWIIIDIKARLVNSWSLYSCCEIELEALKTALDNPTINCDFGLAPAEPLFLMDIEYDLKFELDLQVLERMYLRLKHKMVDIKLKEEFLGYLLSRISKFSQLNILQENNIA